MDLRPRRIIRKESRRAAEASNLTPDQGSIPMGGHRSSRCLSAICLTTLGLLAALGTFPVRAAKPAKTKSSSKRPTVRLGIIHTLFRDTPEPLMQILIPTPPYHQLYNKKLHIHENKYPHPELSNTIRFHPCILLTLFQHLYST